MSIPEGSSAEKKNRIIRGAELVFAEDGYEGASMSRIAARAEVSKGTLYNYFESKAVLFAEFVTRKTTTTLAIVFDPVDLDEPLERILHGTASRFISQIMAPASIVLYRIVIAEASKFPDLARAYWENGPQRGISHMAALLQHQIDAGQLRPADPRLAAGQFLALCQPPTCMMRRLELLPDLDAAAIDAIAADAVRLFLDGHRAG
ncbi:MAG: TetR/AcrR family transcriptional regulator [Gluconacetobacter diazotrophicus]|nr:TetR/AcrR family transcriptional regulator [Gluconacetobacter diazotrophicus]